MGADAQGMRAGILLRHDRFDLMTVALGCRNEQERAQLVDVDPKTIYRARRGVIGEEFIAKTLTIMERNKERLADIGIAPTFEAVFTVGQKQTGLRTRPNRRATRPAKPAKKKAA